jgi:hypothetical protein
MASSTTVYGSSSNRGFGSKIVFVMYANASHCTDTHTNMWGGWGAQWQAQRAQAMDMAAFFARSNARAAGRRRPK